MSDPVMTSLGTTNAGWGVCGFTSTFYAMYDQNHGLKGKLVNATAEYRVLAEIKTYLMLLKAEGSPLLKDITAFTRSFGGGHKKFTVDGYIQRINNAAGNNVSPSVIKSDPLFGIAMPPVAVLDYVRRVFGWNGTIYEHPNCAQNGDGIIGVRVIGTGSKPHKGLIHYVYRGSGTIYTWGKSFGSIQEAANWGAGGKKWEACYFIAVTP